MKVDFDHWPYPEWVAHRGAGKLAPENTLAAFRLGAHHGFRMFECDVKLSADGEPFLLHDDELERTTDGSGVAGTLSWHELSRLDAGGWHGPAHVGEPIPSLERVGAWARVNGYPLNVEVKPTRGLEEDTGRAVAGACAAWWPQSVIPPLLTSFQPASLAAAREAAPQVPRGLLIDAFQDGWLDLARQLGSVVVVLEHTLADARVVRKIHAARMRVGVYTPNDVPDVERVRAARVDMLITDAVDVYSPRS